MRAVGTSDRARRTGPARTGGKGREEPEILEGLARDIVSRLSTTLFAEDDVPVFARTRGEPATEAEEPPLAGRPRAGEDVVTRRERPDLSGETPPARAAGRESGFRRDLPAGRRPVLRALDPAGTDRPALLVRGTVRSGRQVRHNGDIVVLGDVNPGAQVVAARDIVVMGTLRGMAHAGATGDHTAVVAAFRLCPTQLRIASYVARPPEEPGGHPEYPELALVRDGVVVVRPLTTGMLSRLGPDSLSSDPVSSTIRRGP
ncbi:MAG: septum site-determining protein MinC [Bacillota bacterium]